MELSSKPKSQCKSVPITLVKQTYDSKYDDGMFVDDEFPPCIRSLYWKEQKPCADNDRSVMDSYHWARAHTIFHEQKYDVFLDSIEPDDIAQGALGDCYFLSALSAIAEFPKRIEHAFVTKGVQESGRYVIDFCVCGEFLEVVVDDYFPCKPGEDFPAFSKAHGNELWVMLLEKAWAKLNGCYEHIIMGHPAEALRAITGAPCVTISHKAHDYTWDSNCKEHLDGVYGHLTVQQMRGLTGDQIDDIWNQIEFGDRHDYVMCCSAGGRGDGQMGGINDEKFEAMGLISSHAYALIEAHEIKQDGQPAIRLLKLRNPWGGTEWKGAWSDESDKWTPDLKKRLGWTDSDDGDFWMDFEDFLPYFENTVICKMDENFDGVHLDCAHEPGVPKYIMFETTQTIPKMFLTCSQMQRRMARDEDYDPAPVHLILGKLTNDNSCPVEFVDAMYGTFEDLTLDCHDSIKVGKYIIFIEIDWDQKSTAFFNSYDEITLEFNEIEEPFDGRFLEYICASVCKKKGNMMTYAKSNQPNIKRCLSLSDTSSGYGCMYYENNSEFVTLKETVEFTQFKGLKLLPPYKGNSYNITVPPQSTSTVLIRRISPQVQSALAIRARPSFEQPRNKDYLKAKGKKTQVEVNKKKYNMFWYHSNLDFLFDNQTQDEELQVIFNFQIKGQSNPTQWNFSVKPGENVLKTLDAKGGYSYGYRFSVSKQVQGGDIYELIRSKGKKGSVGKYHIDYYYYHHGNQYLWLYDNTNDSVGFKLTCTFKLENLKLEEEPNGANSWTVSLQPNSSVLRKMSVIDAKPFKFSLSMSVCKL